MFPEYYLLPSSVRTMDSCNIRIGQWIPVILVSQLDNDFIRDLQQFKGTVALFLKWYIVYNRVIIMPTMAQ